MQQRGPCTTLLTPFSQEKEEREAKFCAESETQVPPPRKVSESPQRGSLAQGTGEMRGPRKGLFLEISRAVRSSGAGARNRSCNLSAAEGPPCHQQADVEPAPP